MLSLFATLILSLLVLLVMYHYSYWKRRGVLQETPLPFIGNFKGVGSSHHILEVNQRLYNKFKGQAPFAGFYMFVVKTALICDLNLIKNILIKDFANFPDRGLVSNVQDDPLTGNLVSLKGKDWKIMRMKLSPIFTAARMKYMFPTAIKVGQHFATVVSNLLSDGNTTELDVKDLCARFTTDVIGNCAFGIECNSLEDSTAEFRLRGDSVFTKTRHPPLFQLFFSISESLTNILQIKLFPDDLTQFFVNLVKQTVDYRLQNNVKRNDFIDLLIELKGSEKDIANTKLTGVDVTHGLTIEEMTAQTFIFFLAGFETSSATMSFCLYELAQNMAVQENLHKEIGECLKKNQGKLTYENLYAMPYLDQVIAETLRKYPVVPILLRKTRNDYQVPNTHHVIEANTMISIPIHAIHHDPEYYENPSIFDPSRFESGQCEKRRPLTYLPFGDGPRNCIGMRFSKMQTKIGLALLLLNHRFECCSRTENPIQLDTKTFSMSPKKGVYLKVSRW